MSDKAGGLDAWIGPIAAQQWGHVTRQQLLALGVPSRTISSRITTGRLVTVHAGVYAVGYRRIDPLARDAAAVLAAGREAVLSHESAAALWELRRRPLVPEISAPRRIRRAGIRSYHVTDLSPGDLTTHWGIPVTTPTRTLRDIRDHLNADQRVRLANQAKLRKLISAGQAAQLLGHHYNPTRSGGEDRLRKLLADDPDLPPFETNGTVTGREADVWFPDQKVVVELDHSETHADLVSFVEDRRLDRLRARRRILTVRIATEDLDAAPAAVLQELREILATRRKSS